MADIVDAGKDTPPTAFIPETITIEKKTDPLGISDEKTIYTFVVLRDVNTGNFLTSKRTVIGPEGSSSIEEHVILLSGDSTKNIPPGSVIKVEIPEKHRGTTPAYLKIEEFPPDINRFSFPSTETTLKLDGLVSMKVRPTGSQIIEGDAGKVDLALAIPEHKAYEGNIVETPNTPLGNAWVVSLVRPVEYIN